MRPKRLETPVERLIRLLLFAAIVVAVLYAGGLMTGCAQDTPQKGDRGAVGPQGPQGPIGLPGSPGTVITPIQLCAGVPVYPSSFPEYVLVIGTNVYGVYSANGGFLALLPPGTYASNAVGSNCTFTINADGSITR